MCCKYTITEFTTLQVWWQHMLIDDILIAQPWLVLLSTDSENSERIIKIIISVVVFGYSNNQFAGTQIMSFLVT